MPTPATTTELLGLIARSELLPAERLDAFLAQTSAPPGETPQQLSDRLIAYGLLTHFQAEQFLQGKCRGFTIGKYKVLERLGSGGMGTVYLCEHLVVGRKVAVKVLPTSHAANPSALGRFYREARAAGVINHPNLVRAHDIDQESGWHFMVMDYVDGTSLQDLVSRHGPLPPIRAAHYIAQTAAGLQAAHEAGLVHRDVKPSNIMLDRDGYVRLLDLGLARFYDDQLDPLTLKYDEKSVLGTADYVSPEQAVNSHEADIRADIYSLGGTFYYLLAGHPPFPTGRIAQKLIWHQVRQPTPIRELRPQVPESMAAIVTRMLAKDVNERYQQPAEVVAALVRWTSTPIDLPTEAEMPRLSQAATSPASPGSGLSSKSQPGTGIRPTRPSESGIRPTRPSESGRAVTLTHPPTAAETATPHCLAIRPTATDCPRPAETPAPAAIPAAAAAPTRQWWQPAEEAPPPPPRRRRDFNLFGLMLLAMLGGVLGMVLSRVLLVTFR